MAQVKFELAHKTLKVDVGTPEHKIKEAYERDLKKYAPKRNLSPAAAEWRQEAIDAYNVIVETKQKIKADALNNETYKKTQQRINYYFFASRMHIHEHDNEGIFNTKERIVPNFTEIFLSASSLLGIIAYYNRNALLGYLPWLVTLKK